jgi:hypothetical protein
LLIFNEVNAPISGMTSAIATMPDISPCFFPSKVAALSERLSSVIIWFAFKASARTLVPSAQRLFFAKFSDDMAPISGMALARAVIPV